MGFPVGYTEFFLPKIFLYALSLLGLLRNLIFSLLHFLNVPDFPQSEAVAAARPEYYQPVSALLLRELLPAVQYRDPNGAPESCAVCLHEFEVGEEIRPLRNCRHVFHCCCLDRWMDCDQKTCPLCRTQFVPDDMQEEFNQRLWAVSGVGDFYGEYSSVAGL